MRWFSIVALAIIMGTALSPPARACGRVVLDRAVEAEGMRFAWTVDGDTLHGEVEAPGAGWVAVGFNDQPTLAGTRLVMGALGPDGPVVEEHLADPPRHHPRRAVPRATVERDPGGTCLRFSIPLDPGTADEVRLAEGQAVHLTLAWSHSDDLQHHSAMRTATRVRL